MKEIYKFVTPSEDNNFNIFDSCLESNPQIFFHTTPSRNIESILSKGFKFGKELDSVSYANNSSSCLSHRGKNVIEDFVIFVVKFKKVDSKRIRINHCDIHILKEEIQPEIKGYCVIPKEYVHR